MGTEQRNIQIKCYESQRGDRASGADTISETVARMTLYGEHRMSAGGVADRESQAGVGERDCRLCY